MDIRLKEILKGFSRVYLDKERCGACECSERSKLAQDSELTFVGELTEFGCSKHPFYIPVSLELVDHGFIFVNSAQARHHLGIGPQEPEPPVKRPIKVILK